jgi:putative oxygen-independent coproporphyrinogen III oxidase
VLSLNPLPPLALYVHVPWCVSKCPYCDFNSHALQTSLPEDQYVDALIRDLEQELPRVWGRRLSTIYLGGGTPSLMSPISIKRLISRIHALLACAPGLEITLEANPGTIGAKQLAGFRDAGINRISIGIQSFEQEKLKSLGRIHDHHQARSALPAAREAGFDNINLDLMFGLPGQSIGDALTDLKTAIDLGPAHLSLYQLTVEPNTLFYTKPPELPDDDTIWEMQQQLHDCLDSHGYDHYEVSAFCKPEEYCQHNINYWQFGDYLGIGAGAHGKISEPDRITRIWKLKQPKAYMEHAGTILATGGERTLDNNDLAFEFMLNALRLNQGFSPALFQERTGLQLNIVESSLQQAEQKGLITWSHKQIQATKLGQQYLNNLIQLFISDDARHPVSIDITSDG